jgi:hypothetical protein
MLNLMAAACGKTSQHVTLPQEKPREMLNRPLFNEAFSDDFSITVDGTPYRFHTQQIGDIQLPTGKLVACDPLVSCDAAFTKPVPTGSFPLTLAIASIGNDERVGYAKITFAPGRIESWELAVVAGQDVATLKKGEVFGYGVDSGTGGFMDAAALQAYEAERLKGGEPFDQRLFVELDKTYKHTRSWYLLPTEKGTVAMFSSGYGDGFYPTYRCYDKAGKLLAVITDFGLVPWE